MISIINHGLGNFASVISAIDFSGHKAKLTNDRDKIKKSEKIIIPGVKSWMLGVANVRGRLLPIMDLGLFFDLNHRSSNSRDKRVLIFDHGDILSGFVVDSVHGMQYFAADSFKEKYDSKLEKSIRPFVKGAYEKNNRKWKYIFSSR